MNLKRILMLQILILVHRMCYCVDLLSKFHQSDYKTRNLRADTQDINKKLMHSFHAIGYKHNRTATAFNLTFWPKVDLEDKLEAVVQAYKFASNEYRLFPAIRYQFNVCKAISSNVGGFRDILNYGNFTRCYWKKDSFYYFCGFPLDETQFPPLIPTGEYKIVFDLLHVKDKLGILNLYMEVYRREV